MSNRTAVDLDAVMDGIGLKGLPLTVAVCMAAVLIADGFDIIILGYVAPAIAKDFGLSTGGLAGVISISLIGVALGGLIGGYLGDIVGRRAMILSSLLLFGLATLASALTNGLTPFGMARFLAGIGLGAATPNAAALMAEVLPRAWRNQIITVAYASSTIGTTSAGILSRQLLPVWGWRGIFVIGAGIPICVALVLFFVIPESPRFLATRAGKERQLAKVLNRFLDKPVYDGSERFQRQNEAAGGRARDILTAAFRRDTLALWAMIFTILFAWVAIGNWGTMVITSLGYSLPDAVSVMVGYNLSGLAGAVAISFAVRRYGSRVVFSLLAVIAMAASIWIAAALKQGNGTLALTSFAIYVVIAGATLTALLQTSYPVAAQIYPTDFRATGVGWAFSFGRLGAVFSSTITAALMTLGGPPLFFSGVAVAAVGILIAVLILQRHIPAHVADHK